MARVILHSGTLLLLFSTSSECVGTPSACKLPATNVTHHGRTRCVCPVGDACIGSTPCGRTHRRGDTGSNMFWFDPLSCADCHCAPTQPPPINTSLVYCLKVGRDIVCQSRCLSATSQTLPALGGSQIHKTASSALFQALGKRMESGAVCRNRWEHNDRSGLTEVCTAHGATPPRLLNQPAPHSYANSCSPLIAVNDSHAWFAAAIDLPFVSGENAAAHRYGCKRRALGSTGYCRYPDCYPVTDLH